MSFLGDSYGSSGDCSGLCIFFVRELVHCREDPQASDQSELALIVEWREMPPRNSKISANPRHENLKMLSRLIERNAPHEGKGWRNMNFWGIWPGRALSL